MPSTTSSSVAAFDLGYGNLKVIAESLSQNRTDTASLVLPVGAAPFEQAPRTVNGDLSLHGGELVTLPDGTSWVAGIDPTLLSDYARPTHIGYPRTQDYLALYYAGLSKLGSKGHAHIETLVTGLPCAEYIKAGEGDLKPTITERLSGVHQVRSDLTVTVDHVYVIAQPMGAYGALLLDDRRQPKEERRLTDPTSSVLVIDIGFYSVDWVLMRGNDMHPGTTGSSTAATSTILKDAARAITQEYSGMLLSVDKLDAAYRTGLENLRLGQHQVDYRGYIDVAAKARSRSVMSEIASSMRSVKDSIDIVAITGGAAVLIEEAARDAFPHSHIAVVADPVMANTRGYLGIAKARARALQSRNRRQAAVAG